MISAPDQIKLFHTLLKEGPFKGDFSAQFSHRLCYATDNSVYQLIPQGVIYPKDTGDVQWCIEQLNQKQFDTLTLSPRGGGTGTNGQSLTYGYVMDFKRHMNHILELNLDEKWVRVQPGVVLDDLNAFLGQHGYQFGPTVSPSNRATLGGMISTDASGKGSQVYGKTSQHVLGLTFVTGEGRQIEVQPEALSEVAHWRDEQTWQKAISHYLSQLIHSHRQDIEAQFPKLTRFMSGYNLAHINQDETFNLIPLLCGSEGTLGFVTEAKLAIVPKPTFKSLTVISYDSVFQAVSDVSQLSPLRPHAIELMDGNIVQQILSSDPSHELRDLFMHENEAVGAVLYVEQISQDEDDFLSQQFNLKKCLQSATTHAIHTVFIDEADMQAQCWSYRKKGVELAAAASQQGHAIAFIEDTVVPPQALPTYLKQLTDLLHSHDLAYALYGHVDVGCIHIRPTLDLEKPEHVVLLKRLTSEVNSLVMAHGGIFWGEHGKGLRSELNEVILSPKIIKLFDAVKSLFDPKYLLNPGKIVRYKKPGNRYKGIESPLKSDFDRGVIQTDRTTYDTVFQCNGNGACVSQSVSEQMCPSYKATGALSQSPKGRSGLLREWLRLRHKTSTTLPQTHPDNIGHSVKKTLEKDLLASLDQCLECKACTGSCPVQVNIPDAKSLFLSDYYNTHFRPLKDYFLVQFESFLPTLNRFSLLSKPLQAIAAPLLGYVSFPHPSSTSLDTLIKRHSLVFTTQPDNLVVTDKTVLVLVDPITGFFRNSVLEATHLFLTNQGYEPVYYPFFKTGKLHFSKGFRQQFTTIASQHVQRLNLFVNRSVPVIGLEPSTTLLFRDEYPTCLHQTDPLPVYLIQEWLHKHWISKQKPKGQKTSYALFQHCMESSLVDASGKLWTDVFSKAGLSLEVIQTHCCGMAGLFGLEQRHQNLSREVYNGGLGTCLPEEKTVLVTGFSCQEQVGRYGECRVLHPVEVLFELSLV